MSWIKDVCALPATKLFHNAMYDVCWLKAYGVKINGHIVDTMVMAALVDENKFSYSLNSVSYEWLGEVKDETALKEAAAKLVLIQKLRCGNYLICLLVLMQKKMQN